MSAYDIAHLHSDFRFVLGGHTGPPTTSFYILISDLCLHLHTQVVRPTITFYILISDLLLGTRGPPYNLKECSEPM